MTFNPGDQVRYIGPTGYSVTHGDVYTVKKHRLPKSVEGCSASGELTIFVPDPESLYGGDLTFSPELFELIEEARPS